MTQSGHTLELSRQQRVLRVVDVGEQGGSPPWLTRLDEASKRQRNGRASARHDGGSAGGAAIKAARPAALALRTVRGLVAQARKALAPS